MLKVGGNLLTLKSPTRLLNPKLLSSCRTIASALSIKRVGTHNGSFHCDEALACFMLRLTDQFSGAQIVRTRDPQVLDGLDAVVDVGGVYDPTRHRYDHHQKGFHEIFGHPFTTKLSSAGLVYKHFGMQIIAKELQLNQNHPDVHQLFLAIYKIFMEAIDAVDNGINQYDLNLPPKYIVNTSLSSRVSRLNLDWTDSNQSSERENDAFQQAVALAGNEFVQNVHYFAKSWLPARSMVMESLASRKSVDSSGEIVAITCSCPWKLHIHQLEEEMQIDPSIKYVLYPDDGGKTWRLQAVAKSPGRFESRNPLPSMWRGLEREELSKISGIPGCVFVHISGFIGGNNTYDGALAMARESLRA